MKNSLSDLGSHALVSRRILLPALHPGAKILQFEKKKYREKTRKESEVFQVCFLKYVIALRVQIYFLNLATHKIYNSIQERNVIARIPGKDPAPPLRAAPESLQARGPGSPHTLPSPLVGSGPHQALGTLSQRRRLQGRTSLIIPDPGVQIFFFFF